MAERTEYGRAYGKREIDEVVVNGGAHLERLDKKSWFLSMTRKDGSSFCVWFHGTIELTEERDPPKLAVAETPE